MNKEKQILFELLTSVVQKTEPRFAIEADWSMVYSLSIRQGVAGVIFPVVQKLYSKKEVNITQEVLLQWYAISQKIKRQNKKVNNLLGLLVQLFKSSNMSFVLLKGASLAQLYPEPLLRAPGDIDIYLGAKHYDKAKRVLLQNSQLQVRDPHEDIKHFSCNINNVLVELHYYVTLIPGRRKNKYLRQWLESDSLAPIREWEWTCFSPMANIVYTFIHLFVHFIGGSASVKQLLDVAMLMKQYGQEIDHVELAMRLRETGFLKAWQVFGCLMVKYFGFSAKEYPCYNRRYENVADKAVEALMEDNNFRMINQTQCRNKISIYIRLMRNNLRLIELFPCECLLFLCRQIQNTMIKYMHLLRGRIH